MAYCMLNNGVKMPLIGFGTWKLAGDAGLHAIRTAIVSGYRLLDTAQMYENEEIVGQAVKESGVRRENIFITTKLYSPSTSYDKAKYDIRKSLQRLQTPYIDLLLIHEPYAEAPDMYKAMEEVYDAGVVRAIGVSNFNVRQYTEFLEHCRIIPAVNQVECHVYYPRKALRGVLGAHGTILQAWSPLAAGKNNIFTDPVLTRIGKKYGKSPAQVALKYLLNQGIPIVVKSAHRKRMEENRDLDNFYFDESDEKALAALGANGNSLFGWYEE